ncbi:MAG: tetratricopeptide repeat protein [Vicinamibacterales bacterium]
MQTQFAVGRLVVVAGLSLTFVGCAQYNRVKAQMHFKDGTAAYTKQDYRKAATEYEQAVQANPDLSYAYFYLANSYDNLYKPSRAGEAENDSLLQKALTNYKLAADRETDMQRKKLALQYQVAVYGADKLNDPNEAEPLLQKLIQLDPNDSANYFALVKLYEDNGQYEDAETVFEKAKSARPNDPEVFMQIAGYFNRQGEFDKTIEALIKRTELQPDNPEGFYTMATFYWDRAYRDFRLNDADKKDIIAKGLDATDKALKINPDYADALVYKNLLLRLQANAEKDQARQTALLKQADELRDRAEALKKQKAGN